MAAKDSTAGAGSGKAKPRLNGYLHLYSRLRGTR